MAVQPGLSDKELVGLPLPSLPITEVWSSDNSPQDSPSPVYLHWLLPLLRLSLIQWSYRKHFIWPSTCIFFPMGFLGVRLHPSPHGHKHSCVCSLAPGIPEITARSSFRALGHSKAFLHQDTGAFQPGPLLFVKAQSNLYKSGQGGAARRECRFLESQHLLLLSVCIQIFLSRDSSDLLPSPLRIWNSFSAEAFFAFSDPFSLGCAGTGIMAAWAQMAIVTLRWHRGHFPETQDIHLIWIQALGKFQERREWLEGSV